MMKMSSTVAYIILLIGIGDIAKQLDGYLYIPTSKSNQLYHDQLKIKIIHLEISFTFDKYQL